MSLLPCLRGRKDKSCIALFYGISDFLGVLLIDAETEKQIYATKFGGKTLKRFLKDIPKLFGKKLKAVILQFFGFDVHEINSNTELCQAFRTKLNSLHIPHYFTSHLHFLFGTIIIEGNIESSVGDTVVVCRTTNTTIGYITFEYTEGGYKKLDFTQIEITDQATQDAAVNKITELCKLHKKVVFECTCGHAFVKSLKNLLKLKNLIFVERDIVKFTVETSKWLLDKSYKKFFVIPVPDGNYFIMNSVTEIFLHISNECFSPISKTCIIPRSVNVVLQCEKSCHKPYHILHKMEHQKCHQNEITLSVDEESFPSFHVEPIMLPQIEALTTNLDENVESKIPVIGFCDDFSVICVYKDGGYQFIDGWNGIYGTELVISFCKKKPLFGKEALSSSKSTVAYALIDFDQNGKILKFDDPKKPIYGKSKQKPCSPKNETYQYEPGCLVYDIINIMSMPVSKIKVKESWGFRITKDDENPVLLEFRNHEKELKQASPAFLMALLLKEHIKVIKNEIGEKPEKLGFCILDENYGSKEKERIKDGLKEACEMLKIGFEFVDV